jgi:hypothetical protein
MVIVTPKYYPHIIVFKNTKTNKNSFIFYKKSKKISMDHKNIYRQLMQKKYNLLKAENVIPFVENMLLTHLGIKAKVYCNIIADRYES